MLISVSLAQSIAQNMLGIMLLMVPLIYGAVVITAWWLLALTWPSLLALVVTLLVFAWSHLSGTREVAPEGRRGKWDAHAGIWNDDGGASHCSGRSRAGQHDTSRPSVAPPAVAVC